MWYKSPISALEGKVWRNLQQNMYSGTFLGSPVVRNQFLKHVSTHFRTLVHALQQSGQFSFSQESFPLYLLEISIFSYVLIAPYLLFIEGLIIVENS